MIQSALVYGRRQIIFELFLLLNYLENLHILKQIMKSLILFAFISVLVLMPS